MCVDQDHSFPPITYHAYPSRVVSVKVFAHNVKAVICFIYGKITHKDMGCASKA